MPLREYTIIEPPTAEQFWDSVRVGNVLAVTALSAPDELSRRRGITPQEYKFVLDVTDAHASDLARFVLCLVGREMVRIDVIDGSPLTLTLHTDEAPVSPVPSDQVVC